VCCVVLYVYLYCILRSFILVIILQTQKPPKISVGDSVVKEEPEEVRNNSPQQQPQTGILQQLQVSTTLISSQLDQAEFIGNNSQQQHFSLEGSDSNSPQQREIEHVAVMRDSGASPQQSGAKPKQKRRRAKRFCRRANCVKCTTLPCGICGPCRNPAKKSRCVLR
jgi:hypothetical protein